MQLVDPHQVLLMGMHHTGTSILSNLTMKLGFYGGSDASFLRHPHNPLKYWERRDVVMLNQAQLDQKSTSTERLPSWVGYNYTHSLEDRDYENRVRDIARTLDMETPPHSPGWVVKDPRLSLLASTWVRATRRPICVIVVRHPLHTIDSLSTYGNRTTTAQWAQVYARYYQEARHACDATPTVVVEHETLLATPYDTLMRLRGELERIGVRGMRAPSRTEVEALLPSQPTATSKAKAMSHHERGALTVALDTWRDLVALSSFRLATSTVSWPRFASYAVNETYATLLTLNDEAYIMGAAALGASIRGVDGVRDMTVLLTPAVDREWEPLLVHVGWRIRRVQAIAEFWWQGCAQNAQPHQSKRWGHMMSKLWLWTLPYERVIYLDADAVVLQAAPSVVDEFAAEPGRFHEHVNAGIMLLRPCREAFERMLVYGATHAPPRLFGNAVDCTEQALLNVMFPGATRLDTGRADAPGNMQRDDIFAMHWITQTCAKPWDDIPEGDDCDVEAVHYWQRMRDRVVGATYDSASRTFVGSRAVGRRLAHLPQKPRRLQWHGEGEYDGRKHHESLIPNGEHLAILMWSIIGLGVFVGVVLGRERGKTPVNELTLTELRSMGFQIVDVHKSRPTGIDESSEEEQEDAEDDAPHACALRDKKKCHASIETG